MLCGALVKSQFQSIWESQWHPKSRFLHEPKYQSVWESQWHPESSSLHEPEQQPQSKQQTQFNVLSALMTRPPALA